MHAVRLSFGRYKILSVRWASTASANNISGSRPSLSFGASPGGRASSGPNASHIVDEAVKRVASESPRRRRGLSRHSVRLSTTLMEHITSLDRIAA
jgi:hypothetical protein